MIIQVPIIKHAIALSLLLALCFSLHGNGIISFSYQGKKYEDVKVMKVHPDGISVMLDYGIKRFKFRNLPENIQTKYNYSVKKEAEYNQKRTEFLKQKKDKETFLKQNKTILDKGKLKAKIKIQKSLLHSEYKATIGVEHIFYETRTKKVKTGANFEGRKIVDKYKDVKYKQKVVEYRPKEVLIRGFKKRQKRGSLNGVSTIFPLGSFEIIGDYDEIEIYTVDPKEYLNFIRYKKRPLHVENHVADNW